MDKQIVLARLECLKRWTDKHGPTDEFKFDLDAYELILEQKKRIQELEAAIKGAAVYLDNVPVEYGSKLVSSALKSVLDKE